MFGVELRLPTRRVKGKPSTERLLTWLVQLAGMPPNLLLETRFRAPPRNLYIFIDSHTSLNTALRRSSRGLQVLEIVPI